jgi:DNA-binding NtrC family response regulator
MRELLGVAGRVAAADSSVLLLGETGVGKEWVARGIHRDSARARGAFVAINCAAVPAEILESELFGHVKGAFTGALRSRRGHFELAHGGTLFLDEIAEMRPDLQGKLLRAIQDLRVRRVGSEEEVEVDVRLMAATSRDLDRARADGSFRSDLYYRLAVVALRVPPLRERREDVPQLAHAYLDHFRRKLGRPDRRMTQAFLDALLRHDWPGNVRELINVIERSVVLSTRPALDASDLPAEMRGASGLPAAAASAAGAVDDTPVPPLQEWLDLPLRSARRRAVDWFERHYLEASLRAEGGRVGDTATRIGIDPRSLYERMKRHDLRKEDFR